MDTRVSFLKTNWSIKAYTSTKILGGYKQLRPPTSRLGEDRPLLSPKSLPKKLLLLLVFVYLAHFTTTFV